MRATVPRRATIWRVTGRPRTSIRSAALLVAVAASGGCAPNIREPAPRAPAALLGAPLPLRADPTVRTMRLVPEDLREAHTWGSEAGGGVRMSVGGVRILSAGAAIPSPPGRLPPAPPPVGAVPPGPRGGGLSPAPSPAAGGGPPPPG